LILDGILFRIIGSKGAISIHSIDKLFFDKYVIDVSQDIPPEKQLKKFKYTEEVVFEYSKYIEMILRDKDSLFGVLKKRRLFFLIEKF